MVDQYRGWLNGTWIKDHRCSFIMSEVGGNGYLVGPCEVCGEPITKILKFSLSVIGPQNITDRNEWGPE